MNNPAMNAHQFDETEAEAFYNRMASILDHGAVAVMTSLGHRMKLFETMARLPRATSAEIAADAGLAERYVREWLAVMVTGGIIEYDRVGKTYVLPPERAACLTKGSSLGNLAVYAQTIGLAGAIQEELLGCFSTGEGLGYETYPHFHELMAEDSQQTVVDGIGDIIRAVAPDFVNRLEDGIDVLDAGCGAGRAMIRLAELHPASRFTGYDMCDDAVALAKLLTAKKGLENVRFEVRDLAEADSLGEFDLITSFDAVHDMANPQSLLRAISNSLRPGGAHLMQDIGGSAHLEKNADFPFAPLLYMISCMHCTPVSIAQGGEGLGTMWGWETALDMLERAGFAAVARHVLPHDPMNVWFVSRISTEG